MINRIDLNKKHISLFNKLFANNIYIVGGTVRDLFLYKKKSGKKDIDFLVTKFSYEEIIKLLKPYGKANTVGKSFAVIKFRLDNEDYDIAIPRKEKKREKGAWGHKNFIVDTDGVTLEEDLSRRDFTCNSIALRLIDAKIIDPFSGVDDIKSKTLKMTSPQAFGDDPLRVLRAARFSAVYNLQIDNSIYNISHKINMEELSSERICEELFRVMLEARKPSLALHEYFKLGILRKLFPELYKLTLTIQDALFHPEKDEYGHHTVWIHTLRALDIAKKISLIYKLDREETLSLTLGTLMHDLGKSECTEWSHKHNRMTITSIGHDILGVHLAEEMLDRFRINKLNYYPVKETVLKLIKNHHRIYELYRNRNIITFKTLAKLIKEMKGKINLLNYLDFADRKSREKQYLYFKEIDGCNSWLVNKIEEYQLNNKEKIRPIIMGKDLLKLGVLEGPLMGVILKKIYDLQLEGKFKDKKEGIAYFLSNRNSFE